MDAKTLLRWARARAGLTLRGLAGRAGTSHSTLAAYESGRVTPAVDTCERIIRAAGFTVTTTLTRLVASDEERSRELVEVLHLAEQFPARHSQALEFPRFGPR